MNLRPLSEEQYISFIGPALLRSIPKFYPELSEKEIFKALDFYHEYYQNQGVFQLKIFPGLLNELSLLKNNGYNLYVASAKPEIMVKKIANHFDLNKYFDGLYGASADEKTRITKTAILKYAMDSTHSLKENSVMIGDRQTDIDGGKNNDVKTIAVTYGFGPLKEIKDSDPDIIIDKPEEILDAIQKISN